MTRFARDDRGRAAWWLFGLAMAAIIGFVVVSFIGTFVFGVFIYYATRPIYSRIRRRVRPRSLAAGLSLVVLALPALLLLAYAIAIGIQEFSRLASLYDLAGLESQFEPYLDVSDIPVTPAELVSGDRLAALTGAVESASTYLGVLGTGALHLFVMFAVAFYLLRDDHKLAKWTKRRFADGTGVLESYANAVDLSFHQVFFGNILNAVLTAIIGAIVYSLLDLIAPATIAGGIPYPTLLGLLTGIASLIPIVGMKLVYIPAGIYLLAVGLTSGEPGVLWFPLAFFGLSFVVVDTFPDLVLRPYVTGRRLHMGMLMLAYILGPLLFGWYGIFLGPMLLVVVVEFVRLVLPELIAGEPIQPVAVDPTNLTDSSSEPAEAADHTGSEAPDG